MAGGLLLSLLVLSVAVEQVAGVWQRREEGLDAGNRPDPFNSRDMARWLVSCNSWGVLCAEGADEIVRILWTLCSTISVHLNGSPFGNVASFSDGPQGIASGTPYFYLSRLDPTPIDLEHDPRSSLSISESPLGTCGTTDVENPTCARLTLSGKVEEVKEEAEKAFATLALFSKHPEMQGWPKGHDFRFYKLVIQDIFLIDWYGGAKPLPVEEYYNNVGSSHEAR